MSDEVYWSGAAQRQGRAPSLSSYTGQSSLHAPGRRARRTIPPWLATDDARRLAALRAYRAKPATKLKRRAAAERRRAKP